MKFKPVFAVFLTLVLGVTCAGWAQQRIVDVPEWKESEAPPPPAFDVGKLVTFDAPLSSSLIYGVDPASVSISNSDSLVRYVMVATSASGARNVMYEGIRCATGEVKTYARYCRRVAGTSWPIPSGAPCLAICHQPCLAVCAGGRLRRCGTGELGRGAGEAAENPESQTQRLKGCACLRRPLDAAS